MSQMRTNRRLSDVERVFGRRARLMTEPDFVVDHAVGYEPEVRVGEHHAAIPELECDHLLLA